MSVGNKQNAIEIRLVEMGVSLEQIDQAKKLGMTNHLPLLVNLVKMNAITDRNAVEIESKCFHVKIVSIKTLNITKETLELMPEEIRIKYQILPVKKTGNVLTIATSSVGSSQAAISEIQKVTHCFIDFVLAYPVELSEKLSEFSSATANIDEMLEDKAKELNISQDTLDEKLIDDPNGPVAQAISHILTQGVTSGASDIHFEPNAQTLRVRFREDGILHEVKTFDKVFIAPFTAAVKVKASLDIAENRIPQDGAISMLISGRKIDFRVATYPTEHGEKIVLRILDSNKDFINIDSLMLPPQEKQKLVDMIQAPQGLVLMAGPTGSGKTSTLYSILKYLNTVEENILTIEDPIEYRIAGITQGQVNNKKGFTFALGLRAMMRLDPNIILVGEMRDKETADIGAQAALTGHLVLSTIHANSASQTMSRLLDMGVERFVVASALHGVISQRLLRRICGKCKISYKPTEEELLDVGYVGSGPSELFKGKGCSACRGEGYKGRVPVLEILMIYNELRPIISRGGDAGELFKAAVERGMWTIHDDAREKIKAGITSTEEVVRVLGIDSSRVGLKKAS